LIEDDTSLPLSDSPLPSSEGWADQIRRESRSLILMASESGTAGVQIGRPSSLFATESGSARVQFGRPSSLSQEIRVQDNILITVDSRQPNRLPMQVAMSKGRGPSDLREVSNV